MAEPNSSKGKLEKGESVVDDIPIMPEEKIPSDPHRKSRLLT